MNLSIPTKLRKLFLRQIIKNFDKKYYLKIFNKQYRHQLGSVSFVVTMHLGIESEHQVLNGSLIFVYFT